MGHVWVYGPIPARVCIDICGYRYHQRPSGCPGMGTFWHLSATLPLGHAILGDPWCHLRPWWHPGPDCCHVPCQGLGFYWSLSLCWWPWLMWLPKSAQRPRIWVATFVRVGVQGLCCWQVMAIQTWMLCAANWGQGVNAWVHNPTIAGICIDVRGSCWHWELCKCPGSEPPPEAM